MLAWIFLTVWLCIMVLCSMAHCGLLWLQHDPGIQPFISSCIVQLLHMVAQYYLKLGDQATAKDYLMQLEAVDVCNGFLCHTRGLLAQQTGDIQGAKQWFQKGLNAKGICALLLTCCELTVLCLAHMPTFCSHVALPCEISTWGFHLLWQARHNTSTTVCLMQCNWCGI